MASNRPAPEPWYEPIGYDPGFDSAFGSGSESGYPSPAGSPVAFGSGPQFEGEPFGEWNPTEESLIPVRGRHRVVKQRGGGVARSSAVLGVGVIAAVGAGGMATANEKPPVSISMPDLSQVKDKIPDAKSLPGIGALLSDGSSANAGTAADAAPISQVGLTTQDAGAGESLRARIMRQAEQQQSAADRTEREAAAEAAAENAAKAAAEKKAKAEAEKKKAAAEAKRKAEAKAEAARLAELAKSYTSPVSSYTLTSSFGESGSLWSANHTGQDFAAPTGTPAKAVHGGTITEAGWAGSYGYRIVLTLDDGTEVWYCHLSSMVQTSGEVSTGETIGRVGATGNVTGAHLHLEVRPGGGDPVNPLSWLGGFGLNL